MWMRNGQILKTIMIIVCLVISSNVVSGNENAHLISNCTVSLKKCSTDGDVIDFRQKCLNKLLMCPRDSPYLCGPDETGNYLVEKCQKNKECYPGTNHIFVVDLIRTTATLKCRKCLGERFETEFTRSDSINVIRNCTYLHQPSENISGHLILLRQGTAASPSEWHCDSENGFAEEKGHLVCNDVPTFSCHCIRKNCSQGYQLRPDGWCIRCQSKLRAENDFRCENYIWINQTTFPTVTSKNPQIPSSTNALNNIPTVKINVTKLPVLISSTTPAEAGNNETVDTLPWWAVVLIILAGAGLLLGILTIVTTLICKKNRANAVIIPSDDQVKQMKDKKFFKKPKCIIYTNNIQVGKRNTMNVDNRKKKKSSSRGANVPTAVDKDPKQQNSRNPDATNTGKPAVENPDERIQEQRLKDLKFASFLQDKEDDEETQAKVPLI